MPLNYSKWDNLEVSDDSDIEGHPNVDHKSLVRWKQRDIHEKRAVRNQKIKDLEAEIACNDVLLPRLRTITEEVHGATDGPAHFSRIVEQLSTNPSPDAPMSDAPKRLTYDEMILSLLMQVRNEAKEKGVENNRERLAEVLVASLKGHVVKLGEQQEKLKKELGSEMQEKSKKITSEDIHEGWDSHYVPPKPEPSAIYKKGPTKTEKRTDYEVLNTKAVDAAHAAQLAVSNPPSESTPKADTAAAAATAEISTANAVVDDADEGDETDDLDEIPEMTPILEQFSHLPLRGYEQSFHFIQEHRDVYVPGASDALLIGAFRAAREGDNAYARQCVHQSLLLQYCEKLGRDGVRLFFQRMMRSGGDPRAEMVFQNDLDDTYKRVVERAKAAREEEEALRMNGGEQIQLVPEHPGQTITFTIPEGPPPADLRLEGPGTEGLDVEEVRKMLQMRWDVFEAFEPEMKKALRGQSLEEVNGVLARMRIGDAEALVGLLGNAGILNFAEGGIRDETGKNKGEGDEEDEDGEADEEDEGVE